MDLNADTITMVDLGFINTLLTHQIIRQQTIESGITAQLEELFWYASEIERNNKISKLTIKSMQLLADWRMYQINAKLAYLKEHLDTMDAMELRALLSELYAEIEQGEALING